MSWKEIKSAFDLEIQIIIGFHVFRLPIRLRVVPDYGQQNTRARVRLG